MSEVDFELIKAFLTETRDWSRMANKKIDVLTTEIKGLRTEMHEGFAALRSHDHAQHGDMRDLERRVSDIEILLERLSTAQGINADD